MRIETFLLLPEGYHSQIQYKFQVTMKSQCMYHIEHRVFGLAIGANVCIDVYIYVAY